MTVWVVLATGPSMSQAVADSARGCCCVAVSDAWKLRQDADALASADAAWWRVHPEAREFKGRKFTAAPDWAGMPDLERPFGMQSGINSGLLGVKVAVHLGATKVLLLGFDMGGSHFFGNHPKPLRNPDARRFEFFKKQFAAYRPKGVDIVNCTPNSALDCYPKASLEDCLAEPSIQPG